MHRLFIFFVLTASLLLPACASRTPSNYELSQQFQADGMPGFIELKSFHTENWRNTGNEKHPIWLSRFMAELAVREDTFDIDTVVEGRRILKPVRRAGESFKVYGSVQSEPDGDGWRNRFQKESGGIDPSIGRPRNDYGADALIFDSPEARALLADAERRREQQRIADETARAQEAAERKRLEDIETERKKRIEAAVAKYHAVFAPKKVKDMALERGSMLAILATASVDGKDAVIGSDRYFIESDFAKSLVHAGVLKAGQTGIVEITIHPRLDQYFGSPRNDIHSESWNGHWSNNTASYTIRLLERIDNNANP